MINILLAKFPYRFAKIILNIGLFSLFPPLFARFGGNRQKREINLVFFEKSNMRFHYFEQVRTLTKTILRLQCSDENAYVLLNFNTFMALGSFVFNTFMALENSFLTLLWRLENLFLTLLWRLETIVFIELLRRNRPVGRDVYYYKSSGGYEADFVVCNNNIVEEIYQVSYDISKEKTRKREFRGLLAASKETRCDNLFLITDFHREEVAVDEKQIKILPAYDWLIE